MQKSYFQICAFPVVYKIMDFFRSFVRRFYGEKHCGKPLPQFVFQSQSNMGVDQRDIIEGTFCVISYVVNGCSEHFLEVTVTPASQCGIQRH